MENSSADINEELRQERKNESHLSNQYRRLAKAAGKGGKIANSRRRRHHVCSRCTNAMNLSLSFPHLTERSHYKTDRISHSLPTNTHKINVTKYLMQPIFRDSVGGSRGKRVI